jgi:hypothetical protein
MSGMADLRHALKKLKRLELNSKRIPGDHPSRTKKVMGFSGLSSNKR